MRTLLALLGLMILTTLNAQDKGPAGFVSIPAGKLNMAGREFEIKTFYLQDHEVTNGEYQGFLSWLDKNGRKDDKFICAPTLTKEQLKLLPKNYFKSSKFDGYPVVGISQKVMLIYAEFLTQTNPNLKGLFRTLFEREWNYAATGGRGGFTFSCGGSGIDMEGNKLVNFNDGKSKPMPMESISRKANEFGLYNMSGNVAEWINSEGRTKGGSFNDSMEVTGIYAKDPFMGFRGTSPFIGFRMAWVDTTGI